MDIIKFLDLSGLEDTEIDKIDSILFNTSSDYPFPWIFKAPINNDYGIPYTQINLNEISTGTYTSTSDTINYPSPMSFITIPYDPNQLPPMYSSYMPSQYHHPTMYTNYHPQMMANNSNQLHYMYTPNQVFNYPQVPVSYENHQQANNLYSSPPIQNQNAEDVYNNISNGEIANSKKPKLSTPQINSVPQDLTNFNANENESHSDLITTKPNIQACEKKPATVDVLTSPTLIENVKIEGSTIKENGIASKVNDPAPNVNGPAPNVNGPAPNVNGPAPNVWGAKKVWGNLFKKDDATINGVGNIESNVNTSNDKPLKEPTIENVIAPATYELGKYIRSYQIHGKIMNFQPRGLINRSNYCYINSILQALLACPPLCNLLVGLSKELKGCDQVKSIPMIRNMCKLMDQFQLLPVNLKGQRSTKRNKKQSNFNLNCGNPFEASSFYTMLNGTRSDSFLVEGRQEDAEEFLGLLLNGLNDEMNNIIKLIGMESNPMIKQETHQDSDDWKVMGPKNKSSITRKVQFDKTPISDIFAGLLCSKIHKTGDESTVNIQPFFTLQLNIEKADTIMEALENFTTRNQLEGLTSSKTKKTVEAWQQVMIERLPVVLIVHLKCFDYQLNGCTKIMKVLDFPMDLIIDPKILSGKTTSATEKQFKLFAVVYHEGKEASKGHYIADAFHTGYNSWLRYDDSKIRPVLEENVMRPQGFKVPYLLFYQRSDIIKSSV